MKTVLTLASNGYENEAKPISTLTKYDFLSGVFGYSFNGKFSIYKDSHNNDYEITNLENNITLHKTNLKDVKTWLKTNCK